MNEATDLSMGENGGQGNSLKRTHEAAELPSTSEVRQSFMQRQAFSDDDLDSCDGGSVGGRPSTPGPKPGKKTRGRVKINMEFIDNKLRRYTTFSKRKSGIMKKAHELATLTGTQVMLLVASETGHVYTFATRKLQPILSSEAGKQLIQTCLNSPDPPESQVTQNNYDQQRMSAQGFEEPDLSYAPPEESKEGLLQKTYHNMLTAISAQGGSGTPEHQSPSSTSISEIRERSTESPMNLIAVNNTNASQNSRGVSAIHLPGGAYIMSGASQADTRTIQVSPEHQAVRGSVTNSSGLLHQSGLLTQPTLMPERLNDGQIALLGSYGSLQRQVPAMQQVLWAPTPLHSQPVAVMHSSSPPDDKKCESKG